MHGTFAAPERGTPRASVDAFLIGYAFRQRFVQELEVLCFNCAVVVEKDACLFCVGAQIGPAIGSVDLMIVDRCLLNMCISRMEALW